ncbi:MAG: hypothetical protein AB1568_04650 [Thermodesulfobacteriota bacterium]
MHRNILMAAVVSAAIFLAAGNCNSLAADLEIADFSGRPLPALPPAPYAVTSLIIRNAPNQVSHFDIGFSFGEWLRFHSCQVQPPFSGWYYRQEYGVSNINQDAHLFHFFTPGDPIPKGFSGPIAICSFELASIPAEGSEFIHVAGPDLSGDFPYDMAGWTSRSGKWTLGDGQMPPDEKFYPVGDASQNGSLGLEDAVIILEKLTNDRSPKTASSAAHPASPGSPTPAAR